MFTVVERDALRDRVLRLAGDDERVVAGAVVGSLALGGGDRFSDLDLTLNPDGSRLFLEMRGDLTMQSGAEYRNRYVVRMDILEGKVVWNREYYNPIVSARAFGRPIAGQFMLEDN